MQVFDAQRNNRTADIQSDAATADLMPGWREKHLPSLSPAVRKRVANQMRSPAGSIFVVLLSVFADSGRSPQRDERPSLETCREY